MPVRWLYRTLNKVRAAMCVPLQNNDERIESYEVRELIQSCGAWATNSQFHRGDASYVLVNLARLKEYLDYNDVSEYKYISNDFDCNNFAAALMGDVTKWDSRLAFGIVWVKKLCDVDGKNAYHALNFCIAEDKNVWFIEPQTDAVFEVPEGWTITWMTM
jgi:hypothetical protein